MRRGVFRAVLAAAILIGGAERPGARAADASGAGPDRTSILAYLRLTLAEQVAAQTPALTRGMPSERATQVEAAVSAWADGQRQEMRKALESAFGEDARPQFAGAVAAFTASEKAGDATVLESLGAAFDLDPRPASYGELRRAIIARDLKGSMADAADLLAEIQTWSDLAARTKDVPPLRAWLDRDAVAPEKAEAGLPAAQPPVRDLAAMEPAMEASSAPGADETDSPMDDFQKARKARREAALQDAEAGMKQVAAERQAAEEEYGAKKLAAAQAEADAVKKQAERLAAAEKEALDQRQNSWSSRLKSIVGSTLSAAGGAFLGGIGSAAGQEAADALFK